MSVNSYIAITKKFLSHLADKISTGVYEWDRLDLLTIKNHASVEDRVFLDYWDAILRK